MSDRRIRRRRLLSTLGGSLLGTLAGCGHDDGRNVDEPSVGNTDSNAGLQTTDKPSDRNERPQTTQKSSPDRLPSEIFTGENRVFVVNGYSTSRTWPGILQRKLDRYFAGDRVITVVKAIDPGSPIVHWVDPETGDRTERWREILAPALEHEAPVIALAQQSLQGAYGEFSTGIRGPSDQERIQRGADVIETYARVMREDGADHVVVATHIYKEGREPEIGNEQLALEALMERDPASLSAGPDVWEPTRNHHPEAFAEDRVHPNRIGAEIMAHYWFKQLLEIYDRDVPSWSRDEMETALDGETTVDSVESEY